MFKSLPTLVLFLKNTFRFIERERERERERKKKYKKVNVIQFLIC